MVSILSSHAQDSYFEGNLYFKGISWQNIQSRFYSYGGNGVEAKWLVNNIPESGGRYVIVAGPVGSNGSSHIAFSIEGDKTATFNGNVGIGTTNPDPNFKLSVNGSIRSKEVKVEASWSDFVFENGYKLRTLKEVEEHIKEKGHLPEIPSEAEVTQNGINLGEMDSKLLMKIEELTLYMIDMNKRMNELEIENQKLKEEISTLKSN